jgi:hypothetical protein
MAKKKRAKRKVTRLIKKVSHKKKSNTMAKRKRKRSRSITRSVSAPKRRRKKRGLLSASGGSGLVMSLKKNAIGAAGGLVPIATNLLPIGKIPKIGINYGLSILASMFFNPFLGAGIAGATTVQLAGTLFPAFALNDGEMEDTEFVDPNTLSDTGMCDEGGNPIVEDDMGDAYALQDDGELVPMGNSYALQEGTDMRSVSMLPLQDSPYALQSAYGY